MNEIKQLWLLIGAAYLIEVVRAGDYNSGWGFPSNPSPNCPGSDSESTADKIASPVHKALSQLSNIFPQQKSTLGKIADVFRSSLSSFLGGTSNNCPKDHDDEPDDAEELMEEFLGVPRGPPFWLCTDDKDTGCRAWCRDTNPLAKDGWCQQTQYRYPTTCSCDEVGCTPRKHDPLCREKCRRKYGVEMDPCRVTTGQPEFEARRECVCQFKNGTYVFS